METNSMIYRSKMKITKTKNDGEFKCEFIYILFAELDQYPFQKSTVTF